MKILITGAAGNAGYVVSKAVAETGRYSIRLADASACPAEVASLGEFVRCDTRTFADVDQAMEGCDAVIHLAAWHCAHKPPVSDETIFAVNVDGTFNVIQAARKHKVKALVFASSMAYGFGSVYSVSKVVGEDLCRMFHETTGTATVCLRYHDFVPKPYLAFGQKLLFNGVDRRDVATATLASLDAALAGNVKLFMTIVHRDNAAPKDVVDHFATKGSAWLDSQFPGATKLMEKYAIKLPEKLEQHDLSEAARLLNWKPSINFFTFLNDLKRRDEAREDVSKLWAPGQLL
jgi:nucleoside-diphosphate-sugar epimerase